MIPKDKGWGMSNLGLWGKTHVLPPCFDLPSSLVSSNLFIVLLWMVEVVIAEWWWLWQDCPSLPMRPLHQQPFLFNVAWGRRNGYSSLPRFQPSRWWSVRPPNCLLILTQDLVCGCLTQRGFRLPPVHRCSVHSRT